MSQTAMQLAEQLGAAMRPPQPGHSSYAGHLREVKRLIGRKKYQGAKERLRQFADSYPHKWNCRMRTAHDQLLKALG